MTDSPTVTSALDAFRANTNPGTPRFGLEPVFAALQKLGNPQDQVPVAIHITGTNGKGSTASFIRSIAEAAGLKVHAFTSPHLIRVNERIRVAGQLVSDEDLCAALVVVAQTDVKLTYFEALVVAAYKLFADIPADITLIEVGAGGQGDATNVMAKPTATIVTPVSRDHEGLFGVSGEAAIAKIKAGIFRANTPAIIANQMPIPLAVLREEAEVKSAQLFEQAKDWQANWADGAFVYRGRKLNVRAPWLGLSGKHQAMNAGAACAAIECIDDPRLTPARISEGLRAATWPSRLQELEPGPLNTDHPAKIWLDAAHNPSGAATLARVIKQHRPLEAPDRSAIVFAVQAAKDVGGIMAELAPVVDDIFVCPLPDSGGQEGGEGEEPHRLVSLAASQGAHAMSARDFKDAIRLAQAAGADRIYVCGSIYLCGAVLNANGQCVD